MISFLVVNYGVVILNAIMSLVDLIFTLIMRIFFFIDYYLCSCSCGFSPFTYFFIYKDCAI